MPKVKHALGLSFCLMCPSTNVGKKSHAFNCELIYVTHSANHFTGNIMTLLYEEDLGVNSFTSKFESRIIARTSLTWMVPAVNCGRKRDKARDTIGISAFETTSRFVHATVKVVRSAVERWREWR